MLLTSSSVILSLGSRAENDVGLHLPESQIFVLIANALTMCYSKQHTRYK